MVVLWESHFRASRFIAGKNPVDNLLALILKQRHFRKLKRIVKTRLRQSSLRE